MAWTIAIAILLIGAAALFAYVSNSMNNKEHPWLSLAFVFFSLIVLIAATNVGINIVETQNTTTNNSIISPITNRLGAVYMIGMLAIILMGAYFFIYIIVMILDMLKDRKERKEHEL